MASILDRIEDITGTEFFEDNTTITLDDGTQEVISNYHSILTRFVKEGVRDVVDKTLQVNPKDMHLFCQNLFIHGIHKFGDTTNTKTYGEYAVPWKDADGGFKIDNNYILYVSRYYGGLKVPAQEISAEKGLKVEDPESIYYSGEDYRNPIWYRASSKLYIYPDVSSVEEGFASIVRYDDDINLKGPIIDGIQQPDLTSIRYFPNHLLHLVVLYAAIKGLKLVKSHKRKEYTTKYSTPLKTWQTMYGDTATLPALPAFPSNLPDFSTASDDFPTEDYPTIGTSAETAKTIFNRMYTRLNTDEDIELLGGEVTRLNSILAELNNDIAILEKRHGVVLNTFNTELKDFTTKYQTVMDVWSKYQQSYNVEIQLLDAEIARHEKDYSAHFYPKHYLDKTKEEGNY
jgi:hypothetical protein